MSHPSSANPLKGLALHSLVWLACAGLLAFDVPVWLALGGGWLASLSLIWLLRGPHPETTQASLQPAAKAPDSQHARNDQLGTLKAHAGQPAAAPGSARQPPTQSQPAPPPRGGRNARSKEEEWEEF